MRRARLCAARACGFSLIELMVAMMLGLVVVGGVISVFLSNQRVYQTNRALSDVQDGSRIAFEMLARDIRNAGLTACSNSGRVANVLKIGPANGGTTWWGNWNNAVRGFEGDDDAVPAGTGEADRVAGEPSLQLLGGDDTSFSVASHDPGTAQFVLNEASTEPSAGDVFIVCDFDHAAIFQSSSYSAGTKTLGHASTAGNCSTGLGFPTSCGAANVYQYRANAFVTRLNVADWYIGKNPEGSRSLYRFGHTGGTPVREEMVRGVSDFQLSYHQSDLTSTPFVSAPKVTSWGNVTAVRAILTIESSDARASTSRTSLVRSFATTTTVRNRVR